MSTTDTSSQNLIKELIKLGLTDKEAIIYRAAVLLGTFSIAALSHQTKIKRPTCYFLITNLMEKGLVSKLAHSKKSIYLAEHPRQLVAHIKKNLFRAEQVSKDLEQFSNIGQKPAVQILTGQGGVEKVYEDMVAKEDIEIKSILDTQSLYDRTGDYFLKDWITARKNKNISVKSLITTKENFSYLTNKDELRTSRIMPEDISVNGSIGVYNGRVIYISNEKDDFSLIINNKGFSDTLESLFDYLWKKSDKEV